MEQQPSGCAAGFPILGSWVENHWVTVWSTQRFIPPKSSKRVPGTSGDLNDKDKLSSHGGSVALRFWTPFIKMDYETFFFKFSF